MRIVALEEHYTVPRIVAGIDPAGSFEEAIVLPTGVKPTIEATGRPIWRA